MYAIRSYYEQLPELKEEQILLEPARRNTAPCIAYANYKILQKNPNARIVTAPSDHLILKEDVFRITSYNVCYTKLLRKPHWQKLPRSWVLRKKDS